MQDVHLPSPRAALPKLEFGLPDVVPDCAVGAWGATADVVRDNRVQMRPDRQDLIGDPDVLVPLALGRGAPTLTEITLIVEDLLKSGLMWTDVPEPFVLTYVPGLALVADTLGSGDKVYLTAWCCDCRLDG